MKTPVSYRIMQYNILHQRTGWGAEKYLSLGLPVRCENVVKAIYEVNPDVLVLAERHDEWAGIPVDYSDTVDLAALLGSRYAFAEDRIEDGKTVNRTPIVYRTDRFRCVESGSVELGEEMPFERSQNKRVVSYAVLEDVSDSGSRGVRMVVFATHWSSGQPQALVNMQSANMSRIIREVLAREDYARLPVVAAADFNAVYSNEAYRSLLSDCGFADADAAVNGASAVQPIVDHIAIAGCTPERFELVWTPYIEQASDHRPVFCDIKIGG